MTRTPSTTPDTDTAAQSIAEHDAAKRTPPLLHTPEQIQADRDTGSVQDCVAHFDPNTPAFTGVPLPHSGPVPEARPIGTAPLSEPQIASLSLPQVSPANPEAPASMTVPSNLAAHPVRTPGPARMVTRLKMTLHSLTPLNTAADDPLTRCTFGAVYSSNPTEEDAVYGKYTPYGSLSYNVRSDIAAHLVEGKAYYIDIHEAAS